MLDQDFQKLEGTLVAGGRSVKLENPVLNGEQVSFAAVVGQGAGAARYEYSGRIYSHALDGTVRAHRNGQAQELPWSATRTQVWDPRHFARGPSPAVR